MKKLERDGKIAVVYSPGWGSTWSQNAPAPEAEILRMHSEIAGAVLSGDIARAKKIAGRLIGHRANDVDQLEVVWVPKGSQFEITEYDGLEFVHVIGSREYLTA